MVVTTKKKNMKRICRSGLGWSECMNINDIKFISSCFIIARRCLPTTNSRPTVIQTLNHFRTFSKHERLHKISKEDVKMLELHATKHSSCMEYIVRLFCLMSFRINVCKPFFKSQHNKLKFVNFTISW